jgi:hypothetical protein
MSYCRFQNTSKDLADCHGALESGEGADTQLDQYERDAKRSLIQLCRDIVDEFGETLGNGVEGEEEDLDDTPPEPGYNDPASGRSTGWRDRNQP